MYRKTIKFLGSSKVFLVTIAFSVVTIPLAISYPDNDSLGILGFIGFLLFFVFMLIVSPLSVSLANTEKAEKAKIKEDYKKQVIAAHEEFINKYSERIGDIYDEAIDDILPEVNNKDATIILVEIHNRSPLVMGEANEE